MAEVVCVADDGVGAAEGVAGGGTGGAADGDAGGTGCSAAGAAVAPVVVSGAGVWSFAAVEGKSPAAADIDAVNATRVQAAKCGARLRASKVGRGHVIMNLAF